MKHVLLIGSLLLTSSIMADTSLGTQITSGVKKSEHAFQKTTTSQDKVKTKEEKKFKKDHHRYDKRYQNFDYESRGYYNDDGFYFGYFDRAGYFYNNIFFEYNSQYTYRDRFYLSGSFAPTIHHYRVYRYHDDNNWNRVHCYREPDVIVYGHYYDDRYRYRQDNARIDRYQDRRREEYRRDNAYRGSSTSRYQDNYRDSYRDDYYSDRDYYRGDNARVGNYRFSDRSSQRSSRGSTTRQSTRRRDNASVRSHRFSGRSSSSSHKSGSGSLHITK